MSGAVTSAMASSSMHTRADCAEFIVRRAETRLATRLARS